MSGKKSGKARRMGSTRKDLRGLGSQMRDKEADVFATLSEESRTMEHESATTGGEPKPIEEGSRPMGEESWTTGGESKCTEDSMAVGVASWSMERNSGTTEEKREVDYKPEESSLSEKTASLLALAPSHDPYSADSPHLESHKMEKKKRMGSTRRKLPTDLEEQRREGWDGAEQEEWQGAAKHAVDKQAGSKTAQPLGELHTEPQKASECLEGREESTITGTQHAIHILEVSTIENKSADSQLFPQSMYSEEAQKNKQLHLTNESNFIMNLDQSEGRLTDEDTSDRDLLLRELQSTDSGQLGHADVALQLPKSEKNTEPEDNKHEMTHFEHKKRKMGSTRKGGRGLQIKSDREQEIDILPEEMLRSSGDLVDVCVLQGKESQEKSRLDVIQYVSKEHVTKEGLLDMEENEEAEALTRTDRDKEQEKHKITKETNEKHTISGFLGTDMVEKGETQEATVTDIVEDILVDMEGRERDRSRGTGIAEENMKPEVRETAIRAPGLGGTGMVDRETEETTGTRILEFNETHRLRETHVLEDNVAQENRGTDGGQRDEAEKESVADVVLEVNVMKYEGASNEKESTKEEEGDGAEAKKTGKNWRQTQLMQIDLNMLESFSSEKYEQEVTEREKNSPLENPSVESSLFHDESKTFIPEEQVKFTPFEDLLEPCENSQFYKSSHMEAPSTEDENKQNVIVPQEWENLGKNIKTESTHGNARKNKMENRSTGAGDDQSVLEEIRAEKVDVKLEREEKGQEESWAITEELNTILRDTGVLKELDIQEGDKSVAEQKQTPLVVEEVKGEPEVDMVGGIKENKWKLAEKGDIKMKGTNIAMEESVAVSQEFSKTETTDRKKDDSSYIYDPFHNVSVDPIVTERTAANTLSLEMNQKSDESFQKESTHMQKRKKMGSSRKGGRGLHKETETSKGFSKIDGLEISVQQEEREEEKATLVKQNVINVVMEMTKEETKISMAEVTSKSKEKVKITNDNSGAEDFESQQSVTEDPTATEQFATNVVKGFEQHEDYSDRASSRSEKRRKMGTSHRRGRERLKEKEIQEMAETEEETMATDNKESATDEVMKSVQNEERECGNEKVERKSGSGSGSDKSLTSVGVIPNLQRPENSAITTQQECSESQDTFLPAARRKMGSRRQGQDNLRKRDVGLEWSEGCTAEAHINTAALLQRIQEIFHQPDVEEKGCITWGNVQGLSHELGLSIEELHQVFQQLDGDQDGRVTHQDLTESLESCKQEQYFQFKREYSGTHSLGTSGVHGKADFGVKPSINENLLTGSGLAQADPHLREGQALWEKKGTQARSEDTGSISKTQESEEAGEKEEEKDEAGSKEQEREEAGEKDEEKDEAGSKEQEREEAEEKDVETDEAGSKEQEREEAEEKEEEKDEAGSKEQEREEAEEKDEEKDEAGSKEQEREEAEEKDVETDEAGSKEQEREEAEEKDVETDEAGSKEQEREEAEEKEEEKDEAGSKEQEREEAEEKDEEKDEAGSKEQEREEAEEKDVEKDEAGSKEQEREEAEEKDEEKDEAGSKKQEREEAEGKEEEKDEAGSKEQEREEAEEKEEEKDEAGSKEQEREEAGEKDVETDEAGSKEQEREEAGEKDEEKDEAGSKKQEREEAESWNKKNESQNTESKSEDYKAEKEELLSTGHEPEDTHLMNEEGELLNKDQERNYTQFLNQEQQNEGSKELDEVSDEAEGLRQCQGSKEAEIMNEDQDSGKAGLLHKDRDIKKAELANKNEDNDHIKVLNEKEENIMVELLIKNQGCKQEELLSMEEKGVEAEFLSEELNNKEQGNQDTYCEEVEPLNEHRESVVKDSPNQNQDMRMTINLSGEMTHEKEIVMSVKQLVDNESSIQEESKQNGMDAELLSKDQQQRTAELLSMYQESGEAKTMCKDQGKEEREILSRYHGAVQAGIMTMTQNNNVEGMVSKDEESGEAEILNQNQECVELKLLNEDKDNDITEILSKDQVREETDLLGCDMESQLLSKQQQGEKAKILNQCQKGEEAQLLYDDQYNKETMVLGKYNETVTAHMKITKDGNKAEMLSKDQTGEEAELLNQNKQNVEAHILNEGQNGNDLENLGQDRKKTDLLNKHIENELQVMHKDSEEAEILNKCQDRDEAVIISLVQEGEEAEILDKDQDNGELEDQEIEETERLQDEDNEEAEILDQENKEGHVTHKDQKREETALASKDIESEEAEILNGNQEYKEVESLNEDQDNEKADILKKHREGGEFEPLNTDEDREETEIEERYLQSEEAMIMQEDQEYSEVENLNMDQDSEEVETLEKKLEREKVETLNEEQETMKAETLIQGQQSEETAILIQDQESKEAEVMNTDQDSAEVHLLNKDWNSNEVQIQSNNKEGEEAEILSCHQEGEDMEVLNKEQDGEEIMVPDRDLETEEASQVQDFVQTELLNMGQMIEKVEIINQDQEGKEAEMQDQDQDSEESEIWDKGPESEETDRLNQDEEHVEVQLLKKDQDNEEVEFLDQKNKEAEIHEDQVREETDLVSIDMETEVQFRVKESERAEILNDNQECVEVELLNKDQDNEKADTLDMKLDSEEAEITNQDQESVEVYIQHEDQNSSDAENLSKYLEREEADITPKDKQREETDLLSADTLSEETEILNKVQDNEEAETLIQGQQSEETAILIQDQESKEAEVMNTYQDSAEVYLLNKDWNSNEVQIQSNNKEGVEAEILSCHQEGEDMEVLNKEQDGEEIMVPDRDLETEEASQVQDFVQTELLNMGQMIEKVGIINQDQEGKEAEMQDQDQDSEELEIWDKGPESEETDRLNQDEEHVEVQLLKKDQDNEEVEFLDQKNKETEIHEDQVREETDLVSIDMETEVQFKVKESERAEILNDNQECVEVELLNKDQDNEKADTLDMKLDSEEAEITNQDQESVEVYIQHEDQNSSDAENLGKYLEREEADITPKDKQREETDLLSADTLSEETEILNKVQDSEEAETLIQGQQSEQTAILIQDQESKEAEVMNTDQDSAEVHLLNKDWNSNEVQIQSNNKEGEEAEILSCHQEGEDMEVLNKEQDGEEIMVPDRDLETEEASQVQDFVQTELLNMGQMIEKVGIINQDQEGMEAEMLDWDQEYVGVELPCTLQYRYKTHLRDAFDKLREVGGSENECDPDTSRAAVEDNEWIWDCELLKEQQYYSGCNEKKESWDIWDETDEAELGPTAYKERRELGSQIDNVIYWQRWSEDEFGRNNETRQILANDLYPIAEENETENNLEYNNVQITQDIAKIQEMPQAADQSNTIIHFIKDNHELKEIQENKCILSEGECAEQRNIVKLMELRGKTEDLKTFGNNKEHQDVETIEGTTGNTMENRQCPATLANAVNQKDSNDLSECFILDGEKQEANAIKQSPDSVLVRSDVLGGGNTDSTWVPEIPNNDDETICTGMAIQRDSIVREMGAMRGRQAMAETAEGLEVIQNAGFQMDGDRIQMQGSCEKDRGDVLEHLQLSMESDTKWDGGTSQGWDTIAMEMEYKEKTQRQNNYEGAGSKKLSEVITQEVIEHSGGTAGQQKGDGKNWDTFEGGLAQGDIALKHSEEESLHTDRAVEDYSNDCPHEKWDKTPVFSQYRGFEELEQKISTDEEKLLAYQGDGLERKTECLDVGPAQGTIQAKETEVGQQKDKGSDLIESEEASTGFSEDSESLIEKLKCDMNVMELLAEQGEKDNERRDEACKDNNQLLTELVEYSKRGSDMKGVDDTSRSSNKQGVSLIQHVNSEDKEKEGVKKREQGTERHRMTPEEVCGEEELRMEAIRIYEEAEQEMSGDVMAEREAAAKEQKHREDKGKEGFRAMGGGIVVTPEDNRQRAIGCLPTGSWSPPISGPDLLYNIVLVGSSSVGKTSFMKRTQSGEFTLDHCATIGLDSCIQSLLVDGRRVLLQLWDTAGQERYHSITKQILRKAQGLLLMYDITCIDSFNSVQYWMSCIQEGATDDVIIMLLGNKNDSFKREVPLHEGERLAKEYRIKFMECSVATGENVTLSMETLARMLKQQTDQKEEAPLILRKEQPKQRSGCC
ncbi:uncharacterized protein LOC125744541 isoform X8 [Brienomyrus brachyistius]|uniref:uncharacterized protein LOC125744541 isoform X8 n=1 Tax=Brienomyrus brachyistius TaxID=42636 RepID=UPI0020B39008|nr:uncharacterized protein LOC125744541 isoform X8 [Brienomyrus brachyistius]